uniref:Uncharacterized protein n=1 Tax=Prolemur simus TaxID=1328070 RepID=A0A8C9AL94_PROSS
MAPPAAEPVGPCTQWRLLWAAQAAPGHTQRSSWWQGFEQPGGLGELPYCLPSQHPYGERHGLGWRLPSPTNFPLPPSRCGSSREERPGSWAPWLGRPPLPHSLLSRFP